MGFSLEKKLMAVGKKCFSGMPMVFSYMEKPCAHEPSGCTGLKCRCNGQKLAAVVDKKTPPGGGATMHKNVVSPQRLTKTSHRDEDKD
jgi:hypothetical protein